VIFLIFQKIYIKQRGLKSAHFTFIAKLVIENIQELHSAAFCGFFIKHDLKYLLSLQQTTSAAEPDVIRIIKHSEKIIPLTHHPLALIHHMDKIGVTRSDLLKNTEISTKMVLNDSEKISYSQYSRLILNAKKLSNNPALGLEFGVILGLNLHGILGSGALTSTSIYEALSFITKYKPVISPVTHLTLQSNNEKNEVILTVEPSLDSGELLTFFQETILSCLYYCGKKITKTNYLPVNFFFSYPEPSYIKKYEKYLNDNLTFNSTRTEFRYKRSSLEAAMPIFNSSIEDASQEDIQQQFADIQDKKGLLTVIRQHLKEQETKLPTLDNIAEKLNTSASTLKRTLSQHNTNYQEILNEVRKDLACTYLTKEEIPISLIAEKLHFSQISNFRKAFKRWTGHTPQDYRKINRAQSKNIK